MKYKILSAVIATALLSACGGSSSGSSEPTPDTTFTVKAYDPDIANMDVKFECADGTTGIAGPTDGKGLANITEGTPVTAPETCKFAFFGRANAVDMSNGKSMAGVEFYVPEGMAVDGELVTGSPLSTLLFITLEETGATYSESAVSDLLTDLGLESLANNSELSIAEILLNPEAAVASLPAEEASKLLATAAVVSDTIAAQREAGGNPTAASVTTAAKKIADSVLATYPNYPANASGENIYLDVKELSKQIVETPEATATLPAPIAAVEIPVAEAPTGGESAIPADPADDEDDEPATGATGGIADDSTGA